MRHLLVAHHSRGGSTRRLTDAAIEGATAAAGDTVDVVVRSVLDTELSQVVAADAVLLATPANFGWLAGLVKDLLERIYHPCIEGGISRPFGLVVKGDTDVDGAVAAAERILVNGMHWRLVQPPLTVVGAVEASHLEAAWELGASLAAGLDAGLF